MKLKRWVINNAEYLGIILIFATLIGVICYAKYTEKTTKQKIETVNYTLIKTVDEYDNVTKIFYKDNTLKIAMNFNTHIYEIIEKTENEKIIFSKDFEETERYVVLQGNTEIVKIFKYFGTDDYTVLVGNNNDIDLIETRLNRYLQFIEDLLNDK